MDSIFEQLEKDLPPIVWRNWPRWKDFMPVTRGSMANLDSKGLGPKERVWSGKVVGYPRTSLIEWLIERTIVIR